MVGGWIDGRAERVHTSAPLVTQRARAGPCPTPPYPLPHRRSPDSPQLPSASHPCTDTADSPVFPGTFADRRCPTLMLTTIVTEWTDGENTATFAPLGAGRMLLSNSRGEHAELSDDDALSRIDALKDAGWFRSA